MFEFLTKYRGIADGARRFYPVGASDVEMLEQQLGARLPDELRVFYREVGYGWLASEDDGSPRNLFVHPLDILDLLDGSSEFAPPEGFLPGDVPFFDCGGGRFLVVRPKSKWPGAVFRDSGEPEAVSDSLIEFCRELERDPAFYLGTS